MALWQTGSSGGKRLSMVQLGPCPMCDDRRRSVAAAKRLETSITCKCTGACRLFRSNAFDGTLVPVKVPEREGYRATQCTGVQGRLKRPGVPTDKSLREELFVCLRSST